MKLLKKIVPLFLLLLCVAAGCTDNKTEVKKGEDEYIQELVSLYGNKQEDAGEEIDKTLEGLKSVNSDLGDTWVNIMDYWSYVNTEMVVNVDTVPENLPKDNSFCTVVLGFKLNDDGTMQEELIKRLEAGLAIANAYPESYIAVTGGGTAKDNPDVTEGDLMGEWLLEHGVSPERIIVEDSAPNTVGNAENTFLILNEKYPTVNAVVIVTSDYHIPRACILFHSKFMLTALESGEEPIKIITNAAANTGKEGYESFALQAKGVASVAGVTFEEEKKEK